MSVHTVLYIKDIPFIEEVYLKKVWTPAIC